MLERNTLDFPQQRKTRCYSKAKSRLRTDIQELLATRRSLRSARRNRKTRYSKPRFLNRKKDKGWLAPSVQNKVDMHAKMITKVHAFLPVTNVTIEVAQFDIQKIKNPAFRVTYIKKATSLGFWNVREYVFFRDKHRLPAL